MALDSKYCAIFRSFAAACAAILLIASTRSGRRLVRSVAVGGGAVGVAGAIAGVSPSAVLNNPPTLFPLGSLPAIGWIGGMSGSRGWSKLFHTGWLRVTLGADGLPTGGATLPGTRPLGSSCGTGSNGPGDGAVGVMSDQAGGLGNASCSPPLGLGRGNLAPGIGVKSGGGGMVVVLSRSAFLPSTSQSAVGGGWYWKGDRTRILLAASAPRNVHLNFFGRKAVASLNPAGASPRIKTGDCSGGSSLAAFIPNGASNSVACANPCPVCPPPISSPPPAAAGPINGSLDASQYAAPLTGLPWANSSSALGPSDRRAAVADSNPDLIASNGC